jgi:predicted nucleotidyltransferase
MRRDKALSRLRVHEAEFKRLGVQALYLFGFTARGEAREESDVDMFFDYERGKFGLFEIIAVKDFAASVLGNKADVMSRDSIHRRIRENVERSALRVF